MIFGDLLDLVSKEKRAKLRIKAAKKLAVEIGVVAVAGVATGIIFAPKSGKEIRESFKKKAVSTVETIKKEAEKVKNSATHAKQEVSNIC